MKTRILIILVSFYLIFPISVLAKPINEKLERTVINITGESLSDKIVLSIRARDIKSPFQWTLEIISNGKTIFSYSEDDANIDELFKDKDFIGGCTTYIDCKKKWYFKQLLDLVVVKRSDYDLEGILNKNRSGTLYPIGREYLAECCGVGTKKADEILFKIENRIRSGKAVMITIPNPVTAGSLMIYCPEVNRFIPVYSD
ncbi:MAG TPA: hypothetical protein VIS94_01200 [Desulfomonilia bacterium]